MAAIFGPNANLWVKLALGAAAAGLILLYGGPDVFPRLDYATGVDLVRRQPVPFSHKHHVGGDGIDCRYCHTTVETSANAGFPSTGICMTCHSEIWTNAPVLAPLRRSAATGQPLQWVRVNTLPDYVFFDHSIHIAKGVGCTTCHGPIGKMPLTRKAKSLTMSWCLDCHRNPAPHLRPPDEVFNPDWHRGKKTPSGATLMATYHIHPQNLTDCSVCHR